MTGLQSDEFDLDGRLSFPRTKRVGRRGVPKVTWAEKEIGMRGRVASPLAPFGEVVGPPSPSGLPGLLLRGEDAGDDPGTWNP